MKPSLVVVVAVATLYSGAHLPTALCFRAEVKQQVVEVFDIIFDSSKVRKTEESKK